MAKKQSKAKKKTCSKCERSISLIQFYNTNSPLFADKKVPFCKACVRGMMDEDNIDSVYAVLRQIDKPFLKNYWKTAKESVNDTIGDYFRMINSMHQIKMKTWEDSIFDDSDGFLVGDKKDGTKEKDIDEIETEQGMIKVTKELKSKWGTGYSNRSIIEMEKLYLDMDYANDISTPQHKRNLMLYCKLSVLMDKALDDGNFGDYEKLSRQFKTLTESSGFRPIDRKSGAEANGVRSFSQIFEEVEQDGFIEPYPIRERNDIVDRTIQYMLNYQLKLLNQGQLASPPDDTPDLKDDEIIIDKKL